MCSTVKLKKKSEKTYASIDDTAIPAHCCVRSCSIMWSSSIEFINTLINWFNVILHDFNVLVFFLHFAVCIERPKNKK